MYSEIKIYGDCDLNYVVSKKNTVTTEEINDICINGIHSPLWDDDTVTLATFKEDIRASDLSAKRPIVGYIVHRKNTLKQIEYIVAELPANNTHIQDYNVGNKSTYIYIITPLHEDDNGNIVHGDPIITDAQEVNWRSISIIGLKPTEKSNVYEVDNENIWNFKFNIDDITFKPQTNKTVTSGINRYPKIYTSETNYLTWDVNCLIGDISCEKEITYINDNADKLNEWIEFCNNGNLKLFRDIKGHVIPCEVIDTSYTNQNSSINELTTVSFSCNQLLNNNDISVYSTEE